jgi:preprotein translocase subunit YajC
MFIQSAYADENTIEMQESSNLPKAPEQIQNGWISMVPMVLIFVVFYFLLIRPQEKRRRQQETLVAGVKKGEEVITNSGIFGVVTKINDSDNTIELEIAKDVQIKILKSFITDITSRKKEEHKLAKTKVAKGK